LTIINSNHLAYSEPLWWLGLLDFWWSVFSHPRRVYNHRHWTTILSISSHFLCGEQEMFSFFYSSPPQFLYTLFCHTKINPLHVFLLWNFLLWETFKCFSCFWIPRTWVCIETGKLWEPPHPPSSDSQAVIAGNKKGQMKTCQLLLVVTEGES
jgi:hypothetical protein